MAQQPESDDQLALDVMSQVLLTIGPRIKETQSSHLLEQLRILQDQGLPSLQILSRFRAELVARKELEATSMKEILAGVKESERKNPPPDDIPGMLGHAHYNTLLALIRAASERAVKVIEDCIVDIDDESQGPEGRLAICKRRLTELAAEAKRDNEDREQVKRHQEQPKVGPVPDVLSAAIRAVPQVRFALGVAGVAVAAQLAIAAFGGNARLAFIGTLVTIGLMVLLLIFANAAKLNPRAFQAPALVVVWTITVAFVAFLVILVTAITTGRPSAIFKLLFGAT
jgi:hypothetical protein